MPTFAYMKGNVLNNFSLQTTDFSSISNLTGSWRDEYCGSQKEARILN